MEAKGQEMRDRSQPVEMVRHLIDELMECFANIRAAAESLKVKLDADGESPLKADVGRIIQVAKRTEEKVSRFSRTCALLIEDSQSHPAGLVGEALPGFAEYVRRKYGVEIEEGLMTMIEDLIERQKQKVKA